MIRELHWPWLELSIFCPLVAALLSLAVRDPRVAQRVAWIASGLTVVLTIGEWLDFATLGTFFARDRGSLSQRFFGYDFFVIDELTAPLLPLAAILFTLTIVSTMRSKAGRFSFGMALLAEAIVLAMLSTSLSGLLVVLLVASTIPPWLELRQRGTGARMFALYMGLHIGLLVMGMILLAVATSSSSLANLGAGCLVISSLIRAGVFPAHSWIVDLCERASFGAAVLFVVPMTGAYSMMRLVLPIVPDWALHGVAVLALVTSVYAAAMAVVQSEARRFFAFVFISHSALVLAGLEIATPVGMTGGLCVWLGSGLALCGLALTLRAVEARIGRISLDQYHGLFEHMPQLGSFYLLAALASIGFPGSLAFIGMELLVEGTVAVYPLVGTMIVLAAVLNGVAVFRAYFRIFTGSRHVATISLTARPKERLAILTLSLLILATGFWPGPAVRGRYHAADALLNTRQASGIDGDADPDSPETSALDVWLHTETAPEP